MKEYVAVVGAQWGDEGKGKIVDVLAADADAVVRFSGGSNAGHTIVHGSQEYKLHLVPSGILYPDVHAYLGAAMVIDPIQLFRELDELAERGIDWTGRVHVSDRAHVVLPGYRAQDKALDAERIRPIGTTGRGIGVAYAAKAARDGIRTIDLADNELLEQLEPEDRDSVLAVRDRLLPLLVNITDALYESPHRRVLLEGAQGTLLDLDLGTYPFVTSTSVVAGGAAVGAGIGPRRISSVLGVFKAYSTRVGNGPFPTELAEGADAPEAALVSQIRRTGREYGVTTGRARRIGHLDLVALRYACRVNSLDGLVLTHLDVLDDFPLIRYCTDYEVDGTRTRSIPASADRLASATPVVAQMPGWQQSIAGARSWEDLPAEARDYIAMIEDYVETPVTIVSVGFERTQTIIRSPVWSD